MTQLTLKTYFYIILLYCIPKPIGLISWIYQYFRRRYGRKFSLYKSLQLSPLGTKLRSNFLYRAYCTACLLFQIYRVPSSVFSRCSSADGTFNYMVWQCPPVRAFWSEVTAFISSISLIPITCNPPKVDVNLIH